MRLKPLELRTEDEQFSRYIRTEYNKVLFFFLNLKTVNKFENNFIQNQFYMIFYKYFNDNRTLNIYLYDMILVLPKKLTTHENKLFTDSIF